MIDASDKIRILIVGGTAVARIALNDMLAYDETVFVTGLTSDIDATLRRLQGAAIDVVLLNAMAKGDAYMTYLQKIVAVSNAPVIVVFPEEAKAYPSVATIRNRGARDIFFKQNDDEDALAQDTALLCGMVRDIAGKMPSPLPPPDVAHAEGADTAEGGQAPRSERRQQACRLADPPKKLSADVILPEPSAKRTIARTDHIVCIGASTGGTESLRDVLATLPSDAPGIVVVQHMPKHFTASFARHLNCQCAVTVREAAQDDAVERGTVLIAPGDLHILLYRRGTHYGVKLVEGPPVSRHRPSVDVLFRSAATEAGNNAVGVLLTGMGDDGACGLLEMKNAGSFTIAQDEASSIVFGMPKVAIEKGAACKILPLGKIAQELIAADKRR